MMELQYREQHLGLNSLSSRSSQYTSPATALPTVSAAAHGHGNAKLATAAFFRPGYLDGWIKGPLKKGAGHQFPIAFA